MVRQADASGCGRTAGCCDVASEAQEGGLRMQVQVDREKAGRLGVSMQAINDTLNDAFGQRQISTIYAQANQYRVILEAAAALPAGPGRAVEALRHRRQHLDRHRGDRRQHRRGHHQHQHLGDAQRRHRQQPGAARRPSRASSTSRRRSRSRTRSSFPSVTISFNLRARRGAERRGRRDHRRRSATIGMPTSVTGTLFRRRRRVRQVAGRPAVADPRRRRSRSTSCSACCTKASSTRSPSCRRCRRPASARCWR